MVHVIYDPSAETYGDYFARQSGAGMSYYAGTPFQRGYGMAHYGCMRQGGSGLGAVLRSMWRFIMPLARSAGNMLAPYAAEIGRESLATGARFLRDVSEGADLKESLKSHGREGIKNTVRRFQTGSGRRKARRRRHRANHFGRYVARPSHCHDDILAVD